MDGLYGQRCSVCGGFRNELEQGIEFSKEALSQMLREIYDGLNVRDDIQREAFEETLRLFNEATVQGLSDAGYPAGDELFYEQLRTNNEVFSAFRTHRMQNDLAARLVGKDGKLKPFEQWVKDVQDITDHYVVRWLRTEYDTAVLRAHQAADWKRFEAEADVLPNLRWMPTTSPDPDMAHRQYWEAKLTLPVNHSFWTRHRPGDRWNCKCSLMQTDEPPTEGAVADFRPAEKVPGLDNNPADDGKLFGGSHPYYTQAHPGAKKAVEKIVMQHRRKEIRKESERLLDEPLSNEAFGKPISLSRKGIKEWINQPHMHYMEKNEMLLSIGEVMKSARYVGSGPDRHNASITMHLFEVRIKGDKSWIVVREMNDGTARLHSISDNGRILDFIKKRDE